MLQKMHIDCLDINEKIMNIQSFSHFPPSFPHRKFAGVNIKMNIFISAGEGNRFTEHRRGDMMNKKGGEAMHDTEFRVENGVLTAYTGQGSRVILPDGLQEIGREVFSGCAPLASVTFPAGLRVIGERAFSHCTHLRWVKLPAGVATVGARAFYGCEHMMSVGLPEGLRAIGDEAFAWCRSLESVTIPDSVEDVGDGVFTGCHRLREIRVSEDWKSAHPALYEKLMKR